MPERTLAGSITFLVRGRTFTNAVRSSEPTRLDQATGQRGKGIQGHRGDYFGAALSNATFITMWQDGREGTAGELFTAMYACRIPAAQTGASTPVNSNRGRAEPWALQSSKRTQTKAFCATTCW